MVSENAVSTATHRFLQGILNVDGAVESVAENPVLPSAARAAMRSADVSGAGRVTR
jgi:hypothetical protein